MRKILVLLLAMILLESLPARAQSGEEVEAGEVLRGGKAVGYRIRRLPLESFPELPPAVRAVLQERGCMIPQTYEARRPENVVHGELRQKGSSDWAVLCSHQGVTSLFVFDGNAPGLPIELVTRKDTDWLGSQPGQRALGFAWGIDLARARRVREVAGSKFGPYDHDGIEDVLVERSSEIHYYQQGKWLLFEGAAL